MSHKTFNTADEFFMWALDYMARPIASQTFTLDTQNRRKFVLDENGQPIVARYYEPYGGGEPEPIYKEENSTVFMLRRTGESKWRSYTVELPAELGPAIAATWKKNGDKPWSRFVGARTLKTIIAKLDPEKSADLVERARNAVTLRQQTEAKNLRNNRRIAMRDAMKKVGEQLAKPEAASLGLLPRDGETAVAYMNRIAELALEE